MCAGEMCIEPGALAELSNWSRNKKFWFFGGNFFIAFSLQRKGIEIENLPPATNLFEAGFNILRFGFIEDGIILILIMSSMLISYLGYSIYRDMQSPSTFFSAPQEAMVIQKARNVDTDNGGPIINAGEAVPFTFPFSPTNDGPGLRNRAH